MQGLYDVQSEIESIGEHSLNLIQSNDVRLHTAKDVGLPFGVDPQTEIIQQVAAEPKADQIFNQVLQERKEKQTKKKVENEDETKG